MDTYINGKLDNGVQLEKKEYIEYITHLLANNFDAIERIEITLDDMRLRYFEDLKGFDVLLEEIIVKVEKSYVRFYQNNTVEVWDDFMILIESVGALHEKYNSISAQVPKGRQVEWASVGNKFSNVNRVLMQMQEAVELKDEIKMADAIKWEFIPLVVDLRNIIIDILNEVQ